MFLLTFWDMFAVSETNVFLVVRYVFLNIFLCFWLTFDMCSEDPEMCTDIHHSMIRCVGRLLFLPFSISLLIRLQFFQYQNL